MAKSKRYGVRVSVEDGGPFVVGPFAAAGGLCETQSAVRWIYGQLGLLLTHHPSAPLVMQRWLYRETGFSLLPDATQVDICVELAGHRFEVVALSDGDEVRNPNEQDVVDELIEARPITENL